MLSDDFTISFTLTTIEKTFHIISNTINTLLFWDYILFPICNKKKTKQKKKTNQNKTDWMYNLVKICDLQAEKHCWQSILKD